MYKTGDKVLVEMVLEEIDLKNFPEKWATVSYEQDKAFVRLDVIRPYTPRQEFEYGEEVEVDEYGNGEWIKAKFIGTSHNNISRFKYFANKISEEGVSPSYLSAIGCRKPQPRDTITIGGVGYYKDDVETALKDLKPVK